ncbi:MAG: hypothetical protein GYA55_05950 [SAR324 cluster bacterium]|uniref:Uncharacterized protein n=1 Tax=SAR324 cluster bacterium TaxID=2024889 RepID=A0A7X9IJ40_9DELT|nr:hypothetical protein [SAR324 cluster bacterium]
MVHWPRALFLLLLSLLLGAFPYVHESVFAQDEAASVSEVALFLSGLRGPEGSALASLQKSSAWRHYAATLDSQWETLQSKRLNSMEAWARDELKAQLPKSKVLFYMFGGPDLISAHTLFPDVSDYILCGLEPLGSIPPLLSLKNSQLSSGLQILANSLKSIVRLSFFRTLDMQVDFQTGEFSGVLPVLYIFAVRSGHHVTGMTYVSLDELGNLKELPGPPASEEKGVHGIRISMKGKLDGVEQKVYYFKANLVNSSLKKNEAILKFMSLYPKWLSYLKAASYLMHKSYFSIIREFLLKHSLAILEDDSGIPYRFFSPDSWKVTLYGSYSGVIDLFKEYYQESLKKAYSEVKNPKRIPFVTGYTYLRRSNMLLAISEEKGKATPVAEALPVATVTRTVQRVPSGAT